MPLLLPQDRSNYKTIAMPFDYNDYIFSSTSFVTITRAITTVPTCVLLDLDDNQAAPAFNVGIRIVCLSQYGGANVEYALDAYRDGNAPTRLTPASFRQRTTNGPSSADTETITSAWVTYNATGESTTFQLLARRTVAGNTMLLQPYIQIRRQ